MPTGHRRHDDVHALDSGASAVEYALILVGVAAAVIATVFVVRQLVTDTFASQVSRICDPAICSAGGGGGGGGTPLTVTSVSITSTQPTVTSAAGGQARITAVVTPAQCAGRVDFTDTTPVPEVALPSSVVTAGQAAIDAVLSVGDHVISAVFSPAEGSGCAPSEQTATVTVLAATPSLELTGPASVAATGATTSVAVTGTLSPGLCAGTITVREGSTTLGSTTMASSSFPSVGFTVTAALTVGAHPLVATFAASNGLCGTVTSGTFTVTVSDSTPPTVPAITTAQVVRPNNTNACRVQDTGCRVILTWTASTDASGVLRYEVQRARTLPAPPVAYALVGTTAPPTVTLTNVPGDASTYTYQVRACDTASNCSAWSSAVTVVVP